MPVEAQGLSPWLCVRRRVQFVPSKPIITSIVNLVWLNINFGSGMLMTAKMKCHHCQKEIPLLGNVGRREECPFCRQDLHVCKNCVHYDPKAYNECAEPQAERVLEKDRSNFCDYFSPSNREGVANQTSHQGNRGCAAVVLMTPTPARRFPGAWASTGSPRRCAAGSRRTRGTWSG